jgi:acylphosphatase
MPETISIHVTGKVQGVFFRQSAREKAIELGLTGEVKNLDDGTVFIIATGSRHQLETLAEWCKQGPARAKVSSVDVIDVPFQEFRDFTVVR